MRADKRSNVPEKGPPFRPFQSENLEKPTARPYHNSDVEFTFGFCYEPSTDFTKLTHPPFRCAYCPKQPLTLAVLPLVVIHCNGTHDEQGIN